MDKKLQFREKLAGILKICRNKDNIIKKEEVEEYFAQETLSEEQMELVFDYLLSQKVVVKGHVKTGGHVMDGSIQTVDPVLSEEEQQYLRTYEAQICEMKKEEPLAGILQEVVSMAKEMYRPEVFLGDLIQEGNMGVMLAMNEGERGEGMKFSLKKEKELLEEAKERMQALLEAQSEVKIQDKKMADRVNHLDEQIKKLTEELGRKASVDELMEFMEITEEEMEDLLRLAGEEMPN